VGFDKRLLFFDLNTQRVVKQVITDYPLTCLDFQDGVTLAVGTEGSHILSYDLRKTDSPVTKMMGAHSAPAINCLKFQSQRLRRSAEESPDKAPPSGLFQLSSSPSREAPMSPIPPERPAPSSASVARPGTSVSAADGAFIRSCVEDAMAEVRAGVKEDLNNLHLELLRQFHQQMVDMKHLLQGFSDEHSAVVAEVKTMREMYRKLPSGP